jgi:hypothetical protein
MFQRSFRSLFTLGIVLATMAQAAPRVLVYTATQGYRHDSIPTAIEVLGQQGPTYNVSFDFTEDRSLFTQDNLVNYDGIMFVSTSEEGMTAAYVLVSAMADSRSSQFWTTRANQHSRTGCRKGESLLVYTAPTHACTIHRSSTRLLVPYSTITQNYNPP